LPFFLRVLAAAEADSPLTRTAYTLSPTVVKRWLESGIGQTGMLEGYGRWPYCHCRMQRESYR
jgi:hypothetical protein